MKSVNNKIISGAVAYSANIKNDHPISDICYFTVNEYIESYLIPLFPTFKYCIVVDDGPLSPYPISIGLKRYKGLLKECSGYYGLNFNFGLKKTPLRIGCSRMW